MTSCDPQTGSTLATLAVNPARLSVESEKNLIHIKFRVESTEGGEESPQ